MSTVSTFSRRLIQWQREHGRHHLPWQNTRDPYKVWLSEIMLQQTQVGTVQAYFNRFVARFPDVHSLACADLDEVLALWAGLGYYARARNLHACAQKVCSEWQGEFPRQSHWLQTLPGIGASTAAAIAAFCFDERAAILDGNVKRVLARHFGVAQDISKASTIKALWELARSQLPDEQLMVEQPDAMPRYTQALMDLGALTCTRRKPSCQRCPVKNSCIAWRADDYETYGVKPKRAKPKAQRPMQLIWATHAAYVLLERRPTAGVWAGLWCLPVLDDDQVLQSDYGKWARPLAMASFAHELTHFRMILTPHRIEIPEHRSRPEPLADNQAWVQRAELHRYGLPAPIKALLDSSMAHD
jgi:A/G-specific adenine glycosylase